MKPMTSRAMSAALIVAGCLAAGQVVHSQGGGAAPRTTVAPSTSRTGGDAVAPFRIRVPDAVLIDLKQRLSRVRFADEFPGVGWDYGTNLAYIQQLVAYWRDKYDWRAQEQRLNQFDQFKTNIGGLDVHFIHQRSKLPNARPLLLLNGWPSSIVEYVKVIAPLTDPAAHGGRPEDAFHVVVPVMPGYGFSDKPRERGYTPARIAGMWVTLMARLGYTTYSTHGSDWGIAVANHMALQDAGHMFALHLSGCGGGVPPPAQAGAASRPPAPVSANLGYQEIQTTKPQTLGHGLADSPLGLASWIMDKWHSWTDHDGDVEKVYTKDELLTNIMIYWATNTGTSSARLYYESRHVDGRLLPTFGEGFLPKLPEGRVSVPTGCGAFPSQYDRRGIPPADPATARRAAEARYNVVHFAMMPRGGHFPALERPELWLDDLRTFFRTRH
jgi:pimeloyl-ACP methyl ester carboxylesterase